MSLREAPLPQTATGRFVTLRLLALGMSLLAGLSGCLPHVDERAQQFTEDGVDLYRRGDYQNARECFEVALQLQPTDANLMYNVGQCHDRQGQTDKAQEYYRLCLSRSANNARCRHALALLLFRTGKAAEADRMIQEWLVAEPQLPDALVEDGWRLRQEGQLDQAKGRFQQALHYDPHHVRALTELGILYENLRLPERALVLYNRALAREPQQAELVSRVNTLKMQGVGKPLPD